MSDQPAEPAPVEEFSEFLTPEFQEPTPEPVEAPVEILAPELPTSAGPVQDEAPATPEEEALVPDPEASTAFEPGGAYEPPTDFAGHTAFNEQDVQHIQ